MKNKSILDSFHNALSGVIHSYKNERNFKIHLIMTALVLITSICVGVSNNEFLVICLAITFVLCMELMNTAIESVVDLICGENKKELAKVAKDTAAGAVFISSINAIIIGYFIIVRRIINSDIQTYAISYIQDAPIYVTFVCIICVVVATIILKSYTHADNYFQGGMPSAHSAMAFSMATCISFYADNTTISMLSFLLAILVAQSRVEGRIHSILQVILGSLLGFLLTILLLQIISILYII